MFVIHLYTTQYPGDIFLGGVILHPVNTKTDDFMPKIIKHI
jgi:hypothetical protein